MTDVIRRALTAEELKAYDDERALEDQERKKLRPIVHAHSLVADFVLNATTRVSQKDNTKTIALLPETDQAVVNLANGFGVVVDHLIPGYLDTIKITKTNLFMLHVEIETVAVEIDPSRSLLPPADPLPQA